MPTVEIACDESGYEAEKLVGGTTDVFTHAAVRLDTETATECVLELRRRIRSPATEYKANHVLRTKHRAALEWLLGPAGPLHGNARVQLVDKTYFLILKTTALLGGRAGPESAGRLYDEGRRSSGGETWRAFLAAANDLMRSKEPHDGIEPVGSFFAAIEGLPSTIRDVLRGGRSRAESYRTHLHEHPAALPPLDPLYPAILRAVDVWGADGDPVSIVHDRQNTLPENRIDALKEMSGGRLAGLSLANSGFDLRVQVADFLAGVARKLASDQLAGAGDDDLTALVRPYVDPDSVWADEPSWAKLRPAADRPRSLGSGLVS